jgi:septal ring-binding cell division protein DamX
MLEGEISEINLIERLVELWREQFTGAIRFENDGIIKIIYFKSGDILSASTNDRSDSIDEILMRAGKVSREHVKQALAKRKESETLGDALLNLGFITRKELTWARRVQVVGVIRSIAAWTQGSFTIVADYLPKRDEGTLFALPQVLVELIVTEQDRARFERALDGGEAVFQKTGDFEEVWRKLGLNEDAEAIAVEIDGQKSATAVATASGRDTFNVYKLLHALATLGVLSRADKPQAAAQFSLDDFASAGVADAADVWNNPDPELTDADFSLDPQPQPEFQMDDAAPTVQVPVASMYEEEPVATPAVSAWDETDDLPVEDAPQSFAPPAAIMPAWNDPPAPIPAAPVRTPAPSPIVDEPQWGFDEAQLEAARAAANPGAKKAARSKEKKSGGRYGLLVAVMVIAILAGAGYFGFKWWEGRQEAPAPAPVVATRRPPLRPAATGTIVEIPTATDTASTDTSAMTGTVAQVATTTQPATSTQSTTASGLTIVPPPTATTTTTATRTPAPATASAEPATTQALPRVTARGTTPPGSTAASTPGRERVDAMARNYASNATGNFTVQIQILCDASNVEKLMRDAGSNVWFVPQAIGARSCYRVFWGRYTTREQAQAAIAQIPSSMRDRNAAVKPVPKG